MKTGIRWLVPLLALVPALASGQTDIEINAAIELDFTTAGARSLAMGGTFVALADDATAAATNPAGLTILSRPEVSVEYRHAQYTQEFVDRGHGFGPASGDGEDNIDGLVRGAAKDDADSLSYVSGVYPGKGWSVAVYRHQAANLDTNLVTNGPYFSDANGDIFRFLPVVARQTLDVENYGGAVGVDLEWGISLGLGISYYRFELDSRTSRFSIAGDQFDAPPNFDPSNVQNFQTQIGDDDDFALNLGFLWRIDDRVSVGGVYREGPRFNLRAQSIGGPAVDSPGTVFEDVEAVFRVPDVYGVGVAYRPTDALTVSADYDRVVWSQLTERVVTLFGDDDPTRQAAADKLKAESANEIHLGAEYVVAKMKWPLALRGGVWFDPAHNVVHTEGDNATEFADRSLAVRFREKDDDIHFSGGAGLVIGGHLQVDGAFSISDRVDVFSLSSVVRF